MGRRGGEGSGLLEIGHHGDEGNAVRQVRRHVVAEPVAAAEDAEGDQPRDSGPGAAEGADRAVFGAVVQQRGHRHISAADDRKSAAQRGLGGQGIHPSVGLAEALA